MTRCSLCPKYRQPVPPEGPTPCRVMFLFEAPHHKEDQYGRPVIGPTGQELEGLYLPLINLPRSEVYLANTRCCSEQDYANPTPEQAMSCSSVHLGPMLEKVKPQVLVLSGAVSCSLFGINPTTDHGIPRKGKWGAWEGILWPTFHITAGMRQAAYMIPLLNDFDGLRKLLDELDNGTFTWPVDPYPEPDYRVCRKPTDVMDYLMEDTGEELACDTESLPDKSPYCVTFSNSPGTGRLIYVKDHLTLQYLRSWLQEVPPHLIFHNYLHDVTVFDTLSLPIGTFTDTMVHAYNLCLGGGGDDDEAGRGARGSLSLKMLAYRYLHMEMTSFRDTVYPHSIPLMLDWLKQVQQTFAPGEIEPICQCGHLSTYHKKKPHRINGLGAVVIEERHKGPCALCDCKRHKQSKPSPLTEEKKRFNLLHRKTGNLITAIENHQVAEELDMDDEDDYPFVDPWKRVRDWHEWDRGYAREYVGEWPVASVAHVPEKELLRYAVRDADATLRLHLYLSKLHPWLFL